LVHRPQAQVCKRSAGVAARRGRKCDGRFTTCSSSSERTRTQIGYPDPGRGARRQRVRVDQWRRRGRSPFTGNQSPGRLAIGDVRSGSVKRVAAAVGEGAQVVTTLHAFLAAILLQTGGGTPNCPPLGDCPVIDPRYTSAPRPLRKRHSEAGSWGTAGGHGHKSRNSRCSGLKLRCACAKIQP
jgi:hypothetical protein